jgi:zinc protease
MDNLPPVLDACPNGAYPTSQLFSVRLILFGLASLVLAAMPLRAAQAPLPTPTAAPPHVEKVLRATLDNGLRVVIVRDPLAPVVTTEINYLVGSDEAPEGFPGMAHAQEHMMFRGSPGLSANQLADITAAMGGMFDADTQQSVTQYFFTVPAADLDVALHIEAIRMKRVLDSETLWQEERGAIEQEVARDLSSPEYVLYTKLLAAMFKGTPYAHDAPNNAILIVAGDVEPAATLDRIKALFGDIPARKLPERPTTELEPVTPEKLSLPTDLPYGLVVAAYRMPGYESADYPAAKVLEDVLSSQRGSLYALVPEGKALGTGFSMSTMRKAGLGFALAAFPRGGDAKALLAELRSILAADVANGFPADLVAAAKRRELAVLEFEKNSISGLADAWSQAVAVQGLASPDAGVQAIEKVTVDDVSRVARATLDPEHAILAILTPEPSGELRRSKGFGGKESFAPTNPRPVELPAWAAAAIGRLSVPATAVSPTVTKLPNGLTVIVQPESISDTVGVFGGIRNNPDLEAPPGQEGVDQVLEQLFSWGSTSLDRLAFQKALDDIAASESAGTGFSMQALASDFERGVELLADNELHPALPASAFQIVQGQTAQSLKGQLASPGYLAGRALEEGLFPKKDPTLRQATPASVSALTLEDVKAYYAKVFRPDLTTIVVTGNVTPERATAVITKYFGSWRAEGPKPDTLLPRVPLNEPSSTVVPDASRVQDRVILAETLGLTRSNPAQAALEVGNHVLGGAFYATRLYRDLREKTGLVYTVTSSFDIGRTRSLCTVGYACDPDNVAKARAIVVRDLEQMQKQRVTKSELRRAKALLLRDMQLADASLDSIAEGLLARANADLPLDEPTRAAHRFLRVTARQIEKAFATWVRPDGFVQVTQGPNPS